MLTLQIMPGIRSTKFEQGWIRALFTCTPFASCLYSEQLKLCNIYSLPFSLCHCTIQHHTVSQRQLSDRLEDVQFNNLFDVASCADKARLLSTSSPHTSAWLTIVPSHSQGLHLQPNVFQTAIRWWLDISHTASNSLV